MDTRPPEVLFVPALLLLCVVLFFIFLGDRPLWDIDEGMHAVTSKQMVLNGDWVTPYFNGEKFYDKPPLFNWLVAISFLIFGYTEFAARFPAALLGTGCVLLTYFMGRRMFNPMVGFLGAAVLATSAEFIVMSQVVVHDIALAFFVTLSLFLFYLGYEEPLRRRTFLLTGYAAMGVSVVAKGPIGLILPVMIVGLFLISQRNLQFIKEMRMGWGLLVFLAVAAPWYILMGIDNPDYAGYFFLKQNFGNFFSAQESRHPEPFYFYLLVLIGGFLPWSFFLPMALGCSDGGGSDKGNPARHYLMIWAGAVFFFFSVATSKLPTYILPMFPAASLIVADFWHRLADGRVPGMQRGVPGLLGLLSLLLLGGGVYLWRFPLNELAIRYGVEPAAVNTLVLLLLPWSIAAFLFALKQRFRHAFGSLVGLVACGFLFLSGSIVPMISPYRSTKDIGIELGRILPEGEAIVFFRNIRDSALFYTDREGRVIKPPDEHVKFFQSGKQVFCIVKESDLKWFENMDNYYIVSRKGDRLLMSNRPFAGAPDRPGRISIEP